MTNRESIFGVSGGAVPLLLLLLPSLLADLSNAHGAVSKPMGRNYCWQHPDPAVSAACKERYGGSGNYDWMSNNCDGASNAQALASGVNSGDWQSKIWNDTMKNGVFYAHGGCPVCGSAVDTSSPGAVVSTYRQGDTIDVDFDISANHAGGMQVRLCDLATSSSGCTQYQDFGEPLENAESGGDPYAKYTFHVLRSDIGVPKVYNARFRLPAGQTCDHCVLQWWWLTANNGWDGGPNGEFLLAGWPEEFYNCADIKITPTDGAGGGGGDSSSTTAAPTTSTLAPSTTAPPQSTTAAPTTQAPTTPSPTPTTQAPTTPSPAPTTQAPTTQSPGGDGPSCANYVTITNAPGATDAWCNLNCNYNPPFCPVDYCRCADEETATTAPPSPAPTTTSAPSGNITACSNIWTDRKCTNRIRNARENGKLENMCTKWNAGLSCERSCRDLHYSHRNTKCPGDCPKAAIAVEGYFPVFAERLCAQQADENGAAHGHKLGMNNDTWWMPSTGTDFWHGDYPGADAARAAAGVETTSLLRTAKGKKVPSKNKNGASNKNQNNNNNNNNKNNNKKKKKTKKKAAAAGTKSKKKSKAAAAAATAAKPKDATESSDANANAAANAIGNATSISNKEKAPAKKKARKKTKMKNNKNK